MVTTFSKITQSLQLRKKNKPTVVIAKTIKGKGISFMENNNDWHHGRLTKKIFLSLLLINYKYEKNRQKFSRRLGKTWTSSNVWRFMLDLAKQNENLIVLSADLGRSSGLDRFKKEFPNKYLSVGIGEQNLIGVAAGLAKEGFKVFVTSFAPFISMRASEHIRMNLGYMKHPVNLVALGSGVSMGFLGNSHFGLEDLAIMRAIPNMNISAPADCAELGKMLRLHN